MASIFGSRMSAASTSPVSERRATPVSKQASGPLAAVPDSIFHPLSVRVVHMSNSFAFLTKKSSHAFLPRGDILVHSGDFSLGGSDEEFARFDEWLRAVKHMYHYRLVVLGLRDVRRYGGDWEVMKALLPNATHVLCHEEVTVMGLRFYGCPWHWGHDADYSLRSCAPANTSGGFDDIPAGVHVLVTHGAAYGALDATGFDKDAAHLGSRELAAAVLRARPGLHLHGHVCAGRGVSLPAGSHPLTLNSSVCDEDAAVMYATAQVVKASKLLSQAGGSSWSFALGPLDQ